MVDSIYKISRFLVISDLGDLKLYDRYNKSKMDVMIIPEIDDKSVYSYLTNESCRLGDYVFNVYVDFTGND